MTRCVIRRYESCADFLLENGVEKINKVSFNTTMELDFYIKLYNESPTLLYKILHLFNIKMNNEYLLRMAVHDNDITLTRLLLDNGANIHIWDESPLRYAIINKNIEMIDYLIKMGASITNKKVIELINDSDDVNVREYMHTVYLNKMSWIKFL